jgi:hypothetical protein
MFPQTYCDGTKEDAVSGAAGEEGAEFSRWAEMCTIRSHVPKAPIKIGKEKRMKDLYDEGVTNHIGPKSCVGVP